MKRGPRDADGFPIAVGDAVKSERRTRDGNWHVDRGRVIGIVDDVVIRVQLYRKPGVIHRGAGRFWRRYLWAVPRGA